MNTIRIVLVILTIASASLISYGECDSIAFIEEVNSAWVASNYPLIINAITNRLAECTNDLLAMGLYFEYYFSVQTDFTLGQEKASEFITAVSNRVPAEVTEKRVPLGVPISVMQMSTSSNYPVSTPARLEYLHNTYPVEFPHLTLYKILDGRVEAIENGTFVWGVGFVDPEE